jgi:hypothetical protein
MKTRKERAFLVVFETPELITVDSFPDAKKLLKQFSAVKVATNVFIFRSARPIKYLASEFQISVNPNGGTASIFAVGSSYVLQEGRCDKEPVLRLA